MPNMYVLYALEDYYDKTTDKRAIELMLGYCHYLKNLPKQKILSGGWQKYRGEGHLHHIYWLYNRTGQIWLLDLAKKIYSQAAPWTEENIKQGQSQFSHNVNIAEGMRQPATFWQQSHQKEHMEATYNIFNKLYKEYGLPGRSYIGCDFLDKPVQARKGLEACGMVEQILTGLKLLAITGDPIWADHAEQMAFNSLPAATSWDMKSLRYHTSPNIPVSDNTIKTPIFTWKGWMGISGTWMNPNAHRCCQHNIGMGWPNFVKHTWYATSDNGLAAGLLGPSKVNAKIANGKVVTIIENTRYPFREEVEFKLTCSESVNFPLYLRIPGWCENPELKLNGTTLKTKFKPGNFIRIYRKWQNNDKIILRLPMNLKIKRWESLGNAVSVEHGPLTYSLRIRARREKTTTYNWSEEALEFTKKHDLPVDHFAGTNEWPAYNLYPESPWNYALVSGKNNPTENLEVELKKWPDKDTPFKQEDVPVIIKVKGKRLFSWGLEDNNLTEPLPDSPVQTNEKIEQLVLIPMGAARLRITAFPVTGTN